MWWRWDDQGGFTGWYVNLEESGVRWDDGDLAGVDIVDQELDICVEPDRSWLWKDEHELAERLRFPEHYWVHDAEAVWTEGRRSARPHGGCVNRGWRRAVPCFCLAGRTRGLF
ncbi:hypothetical protein GCM10009835_35710 [Planosporangium flavigriseum]|uniref:DUF402 domain-containing protein n=1 Tax=Planosporangium flavigriseum TaxID=373681 RepID=A0A8J3LSW8_9ACTN|nr:hypothetical protein Pfl04_14150 [Planosporangium flavigriseum]